MPFTYFPDASGGTEVYVRGLVAGLKERGHLAAVAAPAVAEGLYEIDGIEVHRFATNLQAGFAAAYGEPDTMAAAAFRRVLAKVRPEVVHLHARTSAVSELLVDAAHEAGAKVVLTYHTPTVSCARGTMLAFGRVPCDGHLEKARCGACVLTGLGMPSLVAWGLARTLAGMGDAVPGPSGRLRGLLIPGLVARSHERFHSTIAKVDHVVAVCAWVRDVLLRNGVSEEKILLCRQGIVRPDAEARAPEPSGQPLRIAFFGRSDPTKGIDVLWRAVRSLPRADVRLDLYLVHQDSAAVRTQLEHRLGADSRIVIRAPVASEDVIDTMASYDLVAVPSLWMETGPLVVLEAFSAGVPVMGSNRGGIAELVRHGVDGILVPPGDALAWANALSRVLDDETLLPKLRAGIGPVRRMSAVVDDMEGLYDRLLANSAERVRLGSRQGASSQ